MTTMPHRLLSPPQTTVLTVLVLAGGGLFFHMLDVDPDRAWRSLLLNNVYFLSISASAACVLAMNSLSRAGWPTVFRRVPEAMTCYLPAGMILMVLLYFGLHSLYHWADAEAVATDPILSQKSPLLNAGGFMTRIVIYAVLWIGLISWMLRCSRSQDSSGDPALTIRAMRASALFAVVFGVSFSLATVDWIMSLEPHWYSTLFPWYVFSSALVTAYAVVILLAAMLRKRGSLPGMNDHHLHDLGKYVFGFSFFWGYLWFSQYLLIWYSNIPEESVYYVLREGHGWPVLFFANVLLNLFIPFVLLLPAAWKKNTRWICWICAVVVVGHWLDFFLMIMPSSHQPPVIGLLEAGMFLSCGSLFLLLFHRAFSTTPAQPEKDPYFQESLHFHGA